MRGTEDVRPPGRLLLDISTLARAGAHADGIVRTSRELVRWAVTNRADAIPVLYDLSEHAFRRVEPRWANAIIDGAATVDTSHFPNHLARKPRLRDRLPPALRAVAHAIQRPRLRLVMALERLRLRTGEPWRSRIERCQATLMSAKQRGLLTDGEGRRRAAIPYDMAVGEVVDAGEPDTVVFTGSDWMLMHGERSHAARGGPKLVLLCYDIIPLLYPAFYLPQDVAVFRTSLHLLFATADLVVFTAERIADDCRAYCRTHGIGLGRTAVVTLGSDFHAAPAQVPVALPAGLSEGRYALFVSTLEPRKGHRLLFSVWKRLMAEGIPQARGFKLVFAGREGWLMESFLAELAVYPGLGDDLIRLTDVSDESLVALYRNAAFCLYPSLYEGFGLPVIEAFRYGKAVLASTGGALPEAAGSFSPCLDPLDEDAWFEALKIWIQEPSVRRSYETAIRTRFQPRGWQETAREFFQTIDRALIQG